MKQIPNVPKKTKQIVSTLSLAEGKRTELAINIRAADGMTNGASNIVQNIIVHQSGKPSGVVWVQFDQADVGEKTRHDNRHLYTQRIKQEWTPIKPITTRFAVDRNRTAQLVRKQFPTRPAATKTVVNFCTKKVYPTFIMQASAESPL